MVDSEFLGIAYSTAHKSLLSLPRETLVDLMKGADIYRDHFDLFY